MLKTVKECDYCSKQADWSGMREDDIPDQWRRITITIFNSNGEPEREIVIEICEEHTEATLGDILIACLE